MIDQSRVDMAMQFALAVARCVHDDDDWMLQDLGPIHLIKYVYLADLAHAEKYGSTFTGVLWTFYHFGPWASEVFERLEPATHAIGAEAKRIESQYGDDFTRWRIADGDDAQRLRDRLSLSLPSPVVTALQGAVRKYGNATPELLHHVYCTSPMLRAAPNEVLVFHPAENSQTDATSSKPSALRPKALKKRKERVVEARRRFAEKARERLRKRADNRATQPSPRYDDVFEEGTRKLDELAGPALEIAGGTLEFSDTIWKSPARTGIDDDW